MSTDATRAQEWLAGLYAAAAEIEAQTQRVAALQAALYKAEHERDAMYQHLESSQKDLASARDELAEASARIAELEAGVASGEVVVAEPDSEPSVPPPPPERPRAVFLHEMLAIQPFGGSTPVKAMVERFARAKSYGIDCILAYHPMAFLERLPMWYAAAAAAGINIALSSGEQGPNRKLLGVVKLFATGEAQYMRGGRPYLAAFDCRDGQAKMIAETGAAWFVPQVYPVGEGGGVHENAQEDHLKRNWADVRRAVDRDVEHVEGFATFYPFEWWREYHSAWFTAKRELAAGMDLRVSISAWHESIARNGRVMEGFGLKTLRMQWLAVIANRDIVTDVELVSGNDESDGTAMLTLNPQERLWRNHWNTHDWPALPWRDGALSYSRYYADWFRTGVRPLAVPKRWVTYRMVEKDVEGLAVPNGRPGEAWRYESAVYVMTRGADGVEKDERYPLFSDEARDRLAQWNLPLPTNDPRDGAWKSLCVEVPL